MFCFVFCRWVKRGWIVITGPKMEAQKRESNYVNCFFWRHLGFLTHILWVSGSTFSSRLRRWNSNHNLIDRLVAVRVSPVCVCAGKSRSGWVGSWQPFIALIAVIHKTQQRWGRSQEEHSPEVVAECLICINLQWRLSDEGMLTCSLKTVKSPCLINLWGIKRHCKE